MNSRYKPSDLVVGDVEFTLIRRPKMKNIRIHVDRSNGSVVVSAPFYASEKMVLGFVQSKLEWIERTRKRFKAARYFPPATMTDGAEYTLWGKRTALSLMDLCSNQELESMPRDELELRKLFEKRMKKELEGVIRTVLPEIERECGVSCSTWSVRNMKTRWGSCTPSTKRIRIATSLVHYPRECLEMVICHELGHINHTDHGPGFKEFMDAHCVDWRQTRAILSGKG